MLIYWLVVQGHAGKFVFGLIGPQKTPVALLVGRAQSVTSTCQKKAFGISSIGIDIHSFYEGHTMDAATFATRVCKLLGVETIIGAFSAVKEMLDLCSDYVHSHQCSWWFEPRLLSRRHRVPK